MLYTFGDHYTLDPVGYELRQHGRLVRLAPQVFDLVAYLVQHPDRTVTKEELLEQLWPQPFVADNSLTYCIAQARKALGDTGQTQRYIQTVRRRGYRFVGAVEACAAVPAGVTAAGVLASGPPRSTRPQTPAHSIAGPATQAPAGAADGGPEPDARGEEAALSRHTPAAAEEWKLVTVLCCAVADPPPGAPQELETHYRQLSALYGLAREAVQRYGGTLQPFAGDHIVALFGAPLAQEEHAQRAVLAALELQRRACEAGSALSAQPGPRRAVRLGLHTGHVAVGLFEATPEGAGAVVGDTLTQASALQAQAAPGTIRCSRATARLVSQVVQVAAVEPAPMAEEPPLDAVYTVLGRRAPGHLLGLQGTRVWTPFIGRTHELATLHALVAQVEAGRGQVVGIIGEPGMGKTRLCYEFIRDQLAQPWCLLDTRAVSYDQAIPYVPVMNLLKAYFQLDEGDPAPVIHDKVTTQLLSLDAALTPLVPAILTLLDVPVEDPQWQALDPPQRRQQTFQAIKQLVLRASQRQPLLVVLENLHWLDTETQACLDALVESLPTARLLLLVTYRPEYQHDWGNKTSYTQIRLDPLPHPQAQALLDALLGAAVELRPLKQQVITLTQGNPFFVEESVQTLIETGGVDGARGAYRLSKPLQMLRVPATVQAVLADRLDRLPPEAKRLVQIAAVIGMEIPFTLLQALAERSEAELRRSLAHLQAVEFLYETSFFPESVYTFKHALTHEVAYSSLLLERRRALHARIVEALEALAGDRVVEQVERLAYHAPQGEVWDKAVTYCGQTGARAYDRAAFREAVAYYEQALQALAHLPEDDDTRVMAIELRLVLGHPLTSLGEYGRGLVLYREAEALARALDDRARLGRVLAHMGTVLRITGDLAGAMAVGRQALKLAAELGDSALQVQSSFNLGQVYYVIGDFSQAAELLRWTVKAVDREAGTRRTEVRIASQTWLAWTLSALGAFAEGQRHGEEALRLATLEGRGSLPIVAHVCLGYLYLAQGDLEHAIRVFEQGLALCRASGDRSWLQGITAGLGTASALQGRLAQGRALLEEAVSESIRIGVLQGLASRVARLSEVCRLAGRGEEAWQHARQALDLARQQKARGDEAFALRQLGAVQAHAALPDVAQAEAHYHQALALADELGMRPLVAHCQRGLGTLYAATGQREQARTALATAIEMYRAMDMTFWLPETEAALAQVEGC
jgi:DNA-binding winged helix-turn-helix (wHTH) protein/tetratricopeptide (TPR) repeat protein/class 3 adenylate cyclase